MNIIYIYHSGFLVETAECYYLFDYYKGFLPALKPDNKQMMGSYRPEIISQFLESYPQYSDVINAYRGMEERLL